MTRTKTEGTKHIRTGPHDQSVDRRTEDRHLRMTPYEWQGGRERVPLAELINVAMEHLKDYSGTEEAAILLESLTSNNRIKRTILMKSRVKADPTEGGVLYLGDSQLGDVLREVEDQRGIFANDMFYHESGVYDSDRAMNALGSALSGGTGKGAEAVRQYFKTNNEGAYIASMEALRRKQELKGQKAKYAPTIEALDREMEKLNQHSSLVVMNTSDLEATGEHEIAMLSERFGSPVGYKHDKKPSLAPALGDAFSTERMFDEIVDAAIDKDSAQHEIARYTGR